MNNWKLFIGNGVNFKNTIKDNIWRIQSGCNYVDYFLYRVKNGDILWFVLSGLWDNTNGQVVGRAVYINHKNDIETTTLQDIEIHYSNLTDYRDYNLYSNITSNVLVTICKKPPDATKRKKDDPAKLAAENKKFKAENAKLKATLNPLSVIKKT
jgi:hypothetical protein